MDDQEFLAARFEEHRTHLRSVAYRMLGSLSEADDAVQETWLRLVRADSESVENMGGWLTTIVGRVCLNMLRSRNHRREDPVGVHVPDPIVSRVDGTGPESEMVLADSIGLALLVVLETLGPAERLAFVLHDLFAIPFDEIASIIGKTPAATRQLASRARRRVQGTTSTAEPDPARQWEVVDAFLVAARGGDLDALVAVLDPDVVVRADGGTSGPSRVLRGASAVAEGAVTFSRIAEHTLPVLVNGAPGAVAMREGRPVSVAAFTVAGGKVVALDILTDPGRLAQLDLTMLDD